MRLIDADKIIFHEIDEVGGEYDPYLGCSKSQIYSLPRVEAIPKVDIQKALKEGSKDISENVLAIVREEYISKADYENRLKADVVAMLTELKNELTDISWNIDMYDSDLDFECCYLSDINKVIRQKIDKLKGGQNEES